MFLRRRLNKVNYASVHKGLSQRVKGEKTKTKSRGRTLLNPRRTRLRTGALKRFSYDNEEKGEGEGEGEDNVSDDDVEWESDATSVLEDDVVDDVALSRKRKFRKKPKKRKRAQQQPLQTFCCCACNICGLEESVLAKMIAEIDAYKRYFVFDTGYKCTNFW